MTRPFTTGKYHDLRYGECMACHDNCRGGCSGPDNSVGPNGCNSCDKAIIGGDLEVVECLPESEPCPEGYFIEIVHPQVRMSLTKTSSECKIVDYLERNILIFRSGSWKILLKYI